MMKKNITIYGNHQFLLELMRDFLDANGFSKLHPIYLVSSNQEIEQIDVAKIDFLILNLTAENINEKFELIDKLLLLNSEMKIIVLSGNSDVKIIKRLFDKGIKAYLGKNTDSEEFLKSIQSAKKDWFILMKILKTISSITFAA
ncbi:response regulator [Kaistella anthropi]|nr:response regulator [Kaistella anthropi]